MCKLSCKHSRLIMRTGMTAAVQIQPVTTADSKKKGEMRLRWMTVTLQSVGKRLTERHKRQLHASSNTASPPQPTQHPWVLNQTRHQHQENRPQYLCKTLLQGNHCLSSIKIRSRNLQRTRSLTAREATRILMAKYTSRRIPTQSKKE